VTCTISRVAGNAQTQGTLYVDSGKVRGDFTAQTPNGPIASHMISDGKTMYVWSSARPQGFKMPAPTPGMAPQPDASQAKIYTQNADYNCSPWTADASEFALPAGVMFADLSSMMGMVGKGPMARPGTPAMNCSLCDQVPNGHGRDQCRAAMHCQ